MAAIGGQAPYGFSWSGGKLVLDEVEATVRRRAFELFAEHQRKGTVARLLSEEGCKSPQGAQIRDIHVKRWLDCESAVGRYPVNKTTKDAHGKRVDRPRENWEYISCPQIVDEKVWEQTREILANQRTPAKRATRTPKQLFSGVAVCECGTKMRVASRSGKYICGSCDNKIPCADLERMFEDELRVSVLPMLQATAFDPKEQAIAKIRAEIGETRSEMASLENLEHKKKITLQRFGERHQPLGQKLESLQAKLKKAQASDFSAEKRQEPDLKGFLKIWPELAFSNRLKLVSALVDRITVRRDVVNFSYKISDLLKEAPTSQHTTNPTNAQSETTVIHRDEPHYIKLPKGSECCKLCGLNRSALGDLIYARPRNGYNPPVKSIKSPHGGGRLIVWASLKKYLGSQKQL